MSKPAVIPRCQHIKLDGVQCGSPALRGKHFCYFHHRMRGHRDLSARRPRLSLPLLEDPASIQCALMQVITALLEGRLESKRASLLLYALQTAAANVKNLPRSSDPEDLVRDLRALDSVLESDEDESDEEDDSQQENDTLPQSGSTPRPVPDPWGPEKHLQMLAREQRYRGLIPQPDDAAASTESEGKTEGIG